MLKILQYGNPILETKSEKVKEWNDPKIKQLIDDMLEVLEAHGDGGAGLSAPQVGVLKRVAICRRLDLEEKRDKKVEAVEGESKGEVEFNPIWEIMINPEIIKKSEKKSVFWEGCLSINQGDLFGEVSRPADVTVGFMDKDGNKKSIAAKGYFSHVVQHEIDHLDGVLFLKYISDPSKLFTGEDLSE